VSATENLEAWLDRQAPPGLVLASGLPQDPVIQRLGQRVDVQLLRHDPWPDWRCANPPCETGSEGGYSGPRPWELLGQHDAHGQRWPDDAGLLEGRLRQDLRLHRADTRLGIGTAGHQHIRGLVLAEPLARAWQVLQGAQALVERWQPWLLLHDHPAEFNTDARTRCMGWLAARGYASARPQPGPAPGTHDGLLPPPQPRRLFLSSTGLQAARRHDPSIDGKPVALQPQPSLRLDPRNLASWGWNALPSAGVQPGARGQLGCLLPRPWLPLRSLQLWWLPGAAGAPARASAHTPLMWLDGLPMQPKGASSGDSRGGLKQHFDCPAGHRDAAIHVLEISLPAAWRGHTGADRPWPWRLSAVDMLCEEQHSDIS
jgi:hypothetical protein